MNFQISPLHSEQFAHLFAMSPESLAGARARRMVATKKPGFPCRVSLADAEVGEEVLLLHYEHQPADTPYRASHAIYVRPNAERALPGPNEVPGMLRTRMLSLRAFDAAGMMVASDITDGQRLEEHLEELFGDSRVEYIHVHFAKAGCYAARVDRA